MFKKRQKLDKLSLEELEQMLRIKRRQARQARFIRLSAAGESTNAALLAQDDPPPQLAQTSPLPQTGDPVHPHALRGSSLTAMPVGRSPAKKLRDLALLILEIGAVVGLIVVLVASYLNLRTLNDEVVEAQETNRFSQVLAEHLPGSPAIEAAPSPFATDRLPGGHTPPTTPGGAVPEIPPHLQNWVQPPPPVPVEQVYSMETSLEATRIVIPKINVDAPIVQGVTWQDLKKGVGQLPNSARPGERGNLYLAAHNDIFGEIFRYLEELEPGDEYHLYAGEAKFTYVVREKRIIEPTEVSVMLSTTEPVATLQTCYPYLIDTHRLVVISDLVN